MNDLLPLAERAGSLLKARNETIAVAESSAGGLISAALLAVPGASAYFLGGAVVYTRKARAELLGIPDGELAGIAACPPSPTRCCWRAPRASDSRTTWALAETGATGPTGNRYGDAAGHACIAVVGSAERAITLETARDDRRANMHAFAAAALALLIESLERA